MFRLTIRFIRFLSNGWTECNIITMKNKMQESEKQKPTLLNPCEKGLKCWIEPSISNTVTGYKLRGGGGKILDCPYSTQLVWVVPYDADTNKQISRWSTATGDETPLHEVSKLPLLRLSLIHLEGIKPLDFPVERKLISNHIRQSLCEGTSSCALKLVQKHLPKILNSSEDFVQPEMPQWLTEMVLKSTRYIGMNLDSAKAITCNISPDHLLHMKEGDITKVVREGLSRPWVLHYKTIRNSIPINISAFSGPLSLRCARDLACNTKQWTENMIVAVGSCAPCSVSTPNQIEESHLKQIIPVEAEMVDNKISKHAAKFGDTLFDGFQSPDITASVSNASTKKHACVVEWNEGISWLIENEGLVVARERYQLPEKDQYDTNTTPNLVMPTWAAKMDIELTRVLAKIHSSLIKLHVVHTTKDILCNPARGWVYVNYLPKYLCLNSTKTISFTKRCVVVTATCEGISAIKRYSGCDCISPETAYSLAYWQGKRDLISAVVIERVNWMDAEMLARILKAIIPDRETSGNLGALESLFLIGDVFSAPQVPWSGMGKIMSDIWDSDCFCTVMTALPVNVANVIGSRIEMEHLEYAITVESTRAKMYNGIFFSPTHIQPSSDVFIGSSIPVLQKGINDGAVCWIAIHPTMVRDETSVSVHGSLFASLGNFMKHCSPAGQLDYQVYCSDNFIAKIICNRYDAGRGFSHKECGVFSTRSKGTKVLIEDYPHMAVIEQHLHIGGPTYQNAIYHNYIASTSRNQDSGWVRVKSSYISNVSHNTCCGVSETGVLNLNCHSVLHGFAVSIKQCRTEPVDYVLLVVDANTKREDIETAINMCNKKLFLCCESMDILEAVKIQRRKTPDTNLSFILRDKIKYNR